MNDSCISAVLGSASVLSIAGFLFYVRWANEQTHWEIIRELAKLAKRGARNG